MCVRSGLTATRSSSSDVIEAISGGSDRSLRPSQQQRGQGKSQAVHKDMRGEALKRLALEGSVPLGNGNGGVGAYLLKEAWNLRRLVSCPISLGSSVMELSVR